MSTLSKQEAAQLKALLQNDSWIVLEKYVAEYTQSIQAQPISGGSAFEELRMMHTNAGKVAGVEELLNLLDTQAFK